MAYITFQPSDHFNTTIYTGNGSAGRALTTGTFQPDWVWFKNRGTTETHLLMDAVRGATKYISSVSTAVEATSSDKISAFTSTGVTLGSSAETNENSQPLVCWSWKANGQGSSNTDGSINTTYTSVNTTSGFSISKYTGAGSTSTVGHGLGVAPKVIMIKGLSNSGAWQFYHEDIGNNKKLILNSTAAEASSGYMNNTSPTSSVFTVVNDSDVGTSGYTYVAYCFAEKKGFSKMGSYTGNGNTNGSFVYTGFKPAMIIFKIYNGGTGSWVIYDSKRNTFNKVNSALFPDLNNAEETADNGFECEVDMLSNGFKLRGSGNAYWMNQSGWKYIYMAFAEEPLVSSNNIPATAR